MKVARFSRVRPVLTVGELFGSTDSGPSGQVPTATGSNGNPIIWGSNVANIFSNTSNHLLSPDVNFLSGAGIAFAASSNTLTISSTVTSGGGGVVGSGLTHAYAGYNTIGGSTETIITRRQYMKKVTLANDAMLVGIGAYIKQTTANTVITMAGGVLTDNAGSPELVIATSSSDTTANAGFYATNTGVAGAARWLHVPVTVFLTAGDYWIAVEFELGSGSSHDVYFDSGSDRYFTNNALRVTDSGWTAVTTSSNKYSIRASTIR